MNVLDPIFIYKVVSLQYCINGYLSIERHLALGTPGKGAGALSRAEIRAMSGNVRERYSLLYYWPAPRLSTDHSGKGGLSF